MMKLYRENVRYILFRMSSAGATIIFSTRSLILELTTKLSCSSVLGFTAFTVQRQRGCRFDFFFFFFLQKLYAECQTLIKLRNQFAVNNKLTKNYFRIANGSPIKSAYRSSWKFFIVSINLRMKKRAFLFLRSRTT